jgi:DNA primase large subunit
MYAYRLDYLYQKQTELEAATSDIDSLRARAARNESEKAQHGIKYDDLLRSIEFQAIEAREKLESLKESGESNWEDLKQGAERAIDDLKASVKDLASRVG